MDSMTILNLSRLFNVSMEYICGVADDDTPENSVKSRFRVPVLGSVPAGVPIEAVEDIIDWEEISPDMLAGGREYFALRVKGDSMYPDYMQGDVVIVRKATTCETGDVCVVYVNGYEATLKQVRLDELYQSMTLVPRNPDYQPRTFSAEEIASLPVSIAGVVVELRRKIK